MKKILLVLAKKMQPSIVQNIIGRLGSDTPKLFKAIQNYCAIIIVVLTAALGAIQGGEITVPHSIGISFALTFLIALFGGIGGASALPTSDLKYVSPEIIEKVCSPAPLPEPFSKN
jgi:hypothetical protein